MKKILIILSVLLLSNSSVIYAQSEASFDSFVQSLFEDLDGEGDITIDEEDLGINDNVYEDTSNGDSELENAVAWMYENKLTMFNTVKKFEPNTALSREAASKFFGVYADQFLNKNESDSFACNFSDKAEANQGLLNNIIQACRLGLFKGTNGKYLPKSQLTNAQALTVLIKALEGNQDSLGKGHWALPFYYQARELGLSEGLSTKNSDNLDRPALRGEIAIMMYRTRNMR